MARPSDVVRVISQSLVIPEPTVTLHSRNLKEAGLRVVSQRGRGAGSMGSRDAAHLLLAAAGATHPKDSIAPVMRQGRMISRAGTWKLPFLTVPEMEALSPDHTLAEAVAALIDSGVSGSLARAASAAYGGEVDLAWDRDTGLAIGVALIGPIPSARITIALLEQDDEGVTTESASDREVHLYNHYAGDGGGNLSSVDQPTLDEANSDLHTERTFTHRSIMRVADLLRG